MSEPVKTARPNPEQRLVVVSDGRPAYPVRAQQAFGISAGDWRALVDAVYPNAKTTEAVELALAYCRARHLDPFKKQCHIVPIWDSKLGREVETIWPGISELRTTAARTGEYAGFDEAAFGPEETREFKGTVGRGQYAKEVAKAVAFPAWCQVTVYRLVQGQRVPFPGPKVRWLETYATMGASDVPNDMWATRPYGQLEKCAEAAALRRAFPEEIGSDYVPEEVGRSRREAIDITPEPEPLGARSAALADRLKGAALPRGEGAVVVVPDGTMQEDARALPPEQELPPGVGGQATAGALLDRARHLLKKHGITGERRAPALELAFGTRSWLDVTTLPAEQLEVGLSALRTHLEGLAAFRNEAPPEREPGEDD